MLREITKKEVSKLLKENKKMDRNEIFICIIYIKDNALDNTIIEKFINVLAKNGQLKSEHEFRYDINSQRKNKKGKIYTTAWDHKFKKYI